MAERHAARLLLLGVLERELGDDRPQEIEELARVPAAEIKTPLVTEILGQGHGVRVGKLGLRHSHGFSFVLDLGRLLNRFEYYR